MTAVDVVGFPSRGGQRILDSARSHCDSPSVLYLGETGAFLRTGLAPDLDAKIPSTVARFYEELGKRGIAAAPCL